MVSKLPIYKPIFNLLKLFTASNPLANPNNGQKGRPACAPDCPIYIILLLNFNCDRPMRSRRPRDAVIILGWIDKEVAKAHVRDVHTRRSRTPRDGQRNSRPQSSGRWSAIARMPDPQPEFLLSSSPDPPSPDSGEITDKASVSRRMVPKARAHLRTNSIASPQRMA